MLQILIYTFYLNFSVHSVSNLPAIVGDYFQSLALHSLKKEVTSFDMRLPAKLRIIEPPISNEVTFLTERQLMKILTDDICCIADRKYSNI